MEVKVVFDTEYQEEMMKARQMLRDFTTSDVTLPPKLLNLAWNDTGTYDVDTNTGGANGSIRNWAILKTDPNLSELAKAFEICEKVKEVYPMITYADIIQLGGVVAVETTGGPPIEFLPGRKDSSTFPLKEKFPIASQDGLQRLQSSHQTGLSEEEIVAVSGGLSLGRPNIRKLPVTEDVLNLNPLKFDNCFFVELLEAEAQENLLHPMDMAHLARANFHQQVELYAGDVNAFFKDYAAAHKRFSELGFVLLGSSSSPGSSRRGKRADVTDADVNGIAIMQPGSSVFEENEREGGFHHQQMATDFQPSRNMTHFTVHNNERCNSITWTHDQNRILKETRKKLKTKRLRMQRGDRWIRIPEPAEDGKDETDNEDAMELGF